MGYFGPIFQTNGWFAFLSYGPFVVRWSFQVSNLRYTFSFYLLLLFISKSSGGECLLARVVNSTLDDCDASDRSMNGTLRECQTLVCHIDCGVCRRRMSTS